MADTAEITHWLDAARDGDRSALDRVLSTFYQELHAIWPGASLPASKGRRWAPPRWCMRPISS